MKALAVIFVVGILIWGLIVSKYFPLAFGLAVVVSIVSFPSSRRTDWKDYRDKSPSFDNLPSNIWYDPD